MNEPRVKTALISVTDKSGLAPFATALHQMGIELIASGGTYKKIKEAGVPVRKVEDVTKFPEMLDGRVKTLHPAIHAGILADRSKKAHLAALRKHKIKPVDLVVVNLYQFKETVAKKNASLQEAIESIDIGGPALIRAAAKNSDYVAVVTEPDQYLAVLNELRKNNGCIPLQKRKQLAAQAFQLSAAYDAAIARFLHNEFVGKEKFPEKLALSFEKLNELRYGENWHQQAALYKDLLASSAGISGSEQLNGKEMSFNNISDASAAIGLVSEFDEPAAVIVKHANPCGAASKRDLATAFKEALLCDRTSAFGSVIALNRECDAATAMQIASFFNEVVIAPSFDETGLRLLRKKKNLRILRLSLEKKQASNAFELKSVAGGLLVQSSDNALLDEASLKVVSKRKPSAKEMQDLRFAWAVAKHVKSNAIVLAKDNATVGIGAGQMSRIDSTEIAVKKSNGRHKGSVLASDAFFPFRDNVDLAAKAGVTAIIQPGGSVRDKEVIGAADQAGIAMLFTGIRHFRH